MPTMTVREAIDEIRAAMADGDTDRAWLLAGWLDAWLCTKSDWTPLCEEVDTLVRGVQYAVFGF